MKIWSRYDYKQTVYYCWCLASFLYPTLNLLLQIFRFKIDDIVSEDLFVFTLNISVCYEAKQSCEKYITIFDGQKIQKPKCDLNTDFVIPGTNIHEICQFNIYLGQ